MAKLDHYAFGVQLAERNISRQYGMTEAWKTLLMRAVSSTSPLSHLAIIGRLGLIKERHGQV